MAGTRADPAASFRFKIEFSGSPTIPAARFTEASGLEFEMETFDYKEGGEQAHVYRLPGRIKQTNLTLKRGIATDGAPLWQWVTSTFTGKINKIKLYKVTVSLMDSTVQQVVRSWTFKDAYPVKWSATALTREQNAIAIETLTLAHQGLLLVD